MDWRPREILHQIKLVLDKICQYPQPRTRYDDTTQSNGSRRREYIYDCVWEHTMSRILPRLSHLRRQAFPVSPSRGFRQLSITRTPVLRQPIVSKSRTANMSTNSNADISKMQAEKDGSFKRKASSFRSHITKDGQYTPEKGALFVATS